MTEIVTVLHIVIAILIIFIVMIQDSKGGAMGGMFGGGGSGSLFGATGAIHFLAKVTAVAAIAFSVTCIYLTVDASVAAKSALDLDKVEIAPQLAPDATEVPVEAAPATEPVPTDK